MDDERVKVYVEITGFTPSLFQQDLIADRVKDVDKWRKAVIWWASNAYRPQSVGKVIEYYEGIDRFGQKKGPDMTVGAWNGTASQPDPPCTFCGRDMCLSNHYEERQQMPIQ